MGSHVMPEYCDRHPSARAWYIACNVEKNLVLTLCDHCTHAMVDPLVAQDFELQKIHYNVQVTVH